MRSTVLVGLLLVASLSACQLGCGRGRQRSIEHTNRGVELLRARSFDAALAELQAATAADPTNGQAHSYTGKVHQEARRWDQAAASFREACRLDPKLAVYQHDLANALQEGGKLDEARQAYLQALVLDPRSHEAHYRLGALFEAQKQPTEAAQHYRQAIALSPRHLLAGLKLGNLYLEQGNAQEALEVLLSLKGANVGDAALRHALGRAYLKLEQPAKAIEELKAAVDADGALHGAIFDLGMAYARAGQKEEARTWLAKATAGGKLSADQQKAARETLVRFAVEDASKMGVLGLLKAQSGSHIASIFGRDSALGKDSKNVLGGLIGNRIGEAYGVGGLGLVGTGRGGGGTGGGSIGLGTIGTIGRGGGGGSGSGYGRGMGGLAPRRTAVVTVGTPEVRGSLDQEVVRRVIRAGISQVRYCYERELQAKPDLHGRVTVQLTIAPAGSVSAAASVAQRSTTGNATVEQCIARAVKRWQFPKPPAGDKVSVSVPFDLGPPGAP